MSITKELREYAEKQIKWLDMTKVHYRKLLAIADRIDAEHQKAIRELNNLADNSVLLPVDADGVTWHVGDRTESGQTIEAMGLNKHGWHFVGTVNEIDPAIHRHYHAPTVEDVLYESLKHFGAVEERTPEVEEWLHEQAAKLRLGEDA